MEGRTDPIWVRRPWRRRGLASALLDVDSENPNEAFTLYERYGFVADREAYEWLRPLPS